MQRRLPAPSTPSLRWKGRDVSWAEWPVRLGARAISATLIVVDIDPARIALSLDIARDGDALAPWSLDDAPADAVLALNAGQFTDAGPWGWVVHRGREWQAPGQGPLSAAFAIDTGGRAVILRADEIADARRRGGWTEVLQSFPLILDDARMPPALCQPGAVDLEHRDIRLTIGTLPNGHVLLALTRYAGVGAAGGRLPIGPTTDEMATIMRELGAHAPSCSTADCRAAAPAGRERRQERRHDALERTPARTPGARGTPQNRPSLSRSRNRIRRSDVTGDVRETSRTTPPASHDQRRACVRHGSTLIRRVVPPLEKTHATLPYHLRADAGRDPVRDAIGDTAVDDHSRTGACTVGQTEEDGRRGGEKSGRGEGDREEGCGIRCLGFRGGVQCRRGRRCDRGPVSCALSGARVDLALAALTPRVEAAVKYQAAKKARREWAVKDSTNKACLEKQTRQGVDPMAVAAAMEKNKAALERLQAQQIPLAKRLSEAASRQDMRTMRFVQDTLQTIQMRQTALSVGVSCTFDFTPAALIEADLAAEGRSGDADAGSFDPPASVKAELTTVQFGRLRERIALWAMLQETPGIKAGKEGVFTEEEQAALTARAANIRKLTPFFRDHALRWSEWGDVKSWK